MATKLNPQTQFLIVAALCLLALLAFFLYYYKPRQETLTTMRDDLAAKQATAAQYRAAQKTVLLPVPKAAGARAGAGAEKARDDDLLQYVADFLTAMAGEPEGSAPVLQPEAAARA